MFPRTPRHGINCPIDLFEGCEREIGRLTSAINRASALGGEETVGAGIASASVPAARLRCVRSG